MRSLVRVVGYLRKALNREAMWMVRFELNVVSEVFESLLRTSAAMGRRGREPVNWLGDYSNNPCKT